MSHYQGTPGPVKNCDAHPFLIILRGFVCIYIYIYIYVYVYVYVHIYTHREREIYIYIYINIRICTWTLRSQQPSRNTLCFRVSFRMEGRGKITVDVCSSKQVVAVPDSS